MKSNWRYKSQDTDWEDIVDLYNSGNAMSVRMAPELNDKHIS